MTTPGQAGSGQPPRRAVAVLVLGVAVAAGAAAITLLSLIMRSVTAIGGSCADGGPYVSAQPCPSGIGTALLLVFASALVCLVGGLWGAAVLKAPLPLLLAWPALFLTLGWNFLEDGFDPPMGEDTAVGYLICGVIFVLMGAGPLLLWIPVTRDDRRTRRARAAAPARSVTGRLQRLAALHASGELTDDEYAQAKRVTLREELNR